MKRPSAEDNPFEFYRHKALEAAKDLGYPKEVRDRIRLAKNETQITNAMIYARRKYI